MVLLITAELGEKVPEIQIYKLTTAEQGVKVPEIPKLITAEQGGRVPELQTQFCFYFSKARRKGTGNTNTKTYYDTARNTNTNN